MLDVRQELPANRSALTVISMTWPQYRRRECSVNAFLIPLTRSETEILSVLLMRYPDTVSKNDLIEALWEIPDNEPEFSEHTIDSMIHNLRKKIRLPYIASRTGFGYRLVQKESDRWAFGSRGPYNPNKKAA